MILISPEYQIFGKSIKFHFEAKKDEETTLHIRNNLYKGTNACEW
jgi:hypothetical protein